MIIIIYSNLKHPTKWRIYFNFSIAYILHFIIACIGIVVILAIRSTNRQSIYNTEQITIGGGAYTIRIYASYSHVYRYELIINLATRRRSAVVTQPRETCENNCECYRYAYSINLNVFNLRRRPFTILHQSNEKKMNTTRS